MFKEWGFLLTEIWVLLVLAALVGLIAGWIIWGRRSQAAVDTGSADRLRAELDACRKLQADKDAQIAAIQAAAKPAPPMAGPTPAAAPPAQTPAPVDGIGKDEGTGESVKPLTLDAPRDGIADDLKKIKGIGPKMEQLCNALGFWHYEQIAAWTDAETAWVDANLEGFKGRVSRDNWVAQAALLAKGGETEFSKRVTKGDVY